MMNKHLSALQYQAEGQLMLNEKGQTLLELIVAIAVAVLVLGSLVFATITSLRNAQLAKNQAQATKLAQEGLEKVRTIRDRDSTVSFTYGEGGGAVTATKFSDFWSIYFGCPGNCYFFLNSSGVLTGGSSTSVESVALFTRQIIIEDGSDGSTQKKITVLVKWQDAIGTHESRLTTILRNLNEE